MLTGSQNTAGPPGYRAGTTGTDQAGGARGESGFGLSRALVYEAWGQALGELDLWHARWAALMAEALEAVMESSADLRKSIAELHLKSEKRGGA